MKFFYCSEALLTLKDYGIQIPWDDSRIKIISDLISSKKQSLQNDFSNVDLSRELLETVHTKEFVSKLLGTEVEKQKVVIETYELIGQDGTFLRYDPSLAIRPL